ncbi:hypothetical protein HPP92_016409 [Vanilla planifolia]|uniref:Uncharacterized protein n=1 Tax=Vanilla planifolia TaxID=51239 RepID=A0A835QHH6_VANPL|nr:hypothetical protein HPP92_016409 [Vanilla planifolia]
MDNDGTLNWGAYYRPPLFKSNLGLQLMPNVGEGVTKPFFSGGGGGGSHVHLECAIPEPVSMSMTLARDSWFHTAGENGRMFHGFIGGHHEHSSGYTAVLPETMRPSIGAGVHALHMLQLIDPPREGKPPLVEDPCAPLVGSGSLKKKSKGKVHPLKPSSQNEPRRLLPQWKSHLSFWREEIDKEEC